MYPYTITQIPQAGILTLVVPRELDGKRLVVTIREDSVEHDLSVNPNVQLLNLLLAAPTLSEEELGGFSEVRAHINEWRNV
jgi:hypothetical protein